MLRNLIFLLWFPTSSAVLMTIAILFGWLDKSHRFYMFLAWLWCRSALFVSGIRLDFDRAALDTHKRPVVFISNHQSYLDILVLYVALNRVPFGFVAKESLFKIPLFAQAMRVSGHVPINRENPRQAMKSIDKAVKHTQKGWSILLFPEGTRGGDTSDMNEFQVGGMILALKTGLPVVPVVLTGTGKAMPKDRKLFAPGRHTARVKVLPAIETQGNYTLKDRERLKDDLRDLMRSNLKEMLGDGS